MPRLTEPTLNTIVIYELHIGTFGNTFAGAIKKLDYLKKLGINAVEILPINETPSSPITFRQITIGVRYGTTLRDQSKYGTTREFKEFVRQCHQRQIAVIVGVVYNHLTGNNLLNQFGGFTAPQIPDGIYFMAAIGPPPTLVHARITVALRSVSTLSITRYRCCATTGSMDFGWTTQ